MNERDALALVRRLLAEALGQPAPYKFIRDLADQNGSLRATMRAALVVIDTATEPTETPGDAS